ncbi:hypothetical protein POM88_025976 [Heracleum sosnowskyi]|uniref:Helitron helicase-like domain-containing protein n=1 Tax=Heracleum sosnowskyi TaxID=360622 RepID=A0AAD8MNF5_9APIA|nr:hypothetical protein POM88_025976 [Heracleum sosnowskyi]
MDGEKPWRLFDFDDMVKGYDRKKSKKRLPKVRKDNEIRSGSRTNVFDGNKVIGSSSNPSPTAHEGITRKSSQVNKKNDLTFIPCTTDVVELCSPFSEIRNQSYVRNTNHSSNRSPLSSITNLVTTPNSAPAEIITTGGTNNVKARGGTYTVETSKKRDLFKRKAKPAFTGSSSTPSPTAHDGITRKSSEVKKKNDLTFIPCTTNVAELSSPFSEIPNQSYVRSTNQSSNRITLSNITNLNSTPDSASAEIITTGGTNNVKARGGTFTVETSKKCQLFKRKAKTTFIGLGKTLFSEGLVHVEDQSNDFNEGPNVIGNTLSSDKSEDLDYDCIEIIIDEDEDSLSQYDYVVDEDSEVDDYTEMKAFSSMPQRRRGLRVVPEQYASLGGPSEICSNCNARMWKEERVNKNVTKGTPIFSLCCMKGAVKLPKVPRTPRYLMDLYNDKRKDRKSVDNEVVQGLITMLDETNELVGKFRQQRDLYESDEIVDLEITLKVCRSESGRENHMTESDEVAGIMIGDNEDTCGERDIIVRDTTIGLVRVSYVHPKLMALQYPLLFPTGEDGFHPMIKFQNTPGSSNKVRDHISMKYYYSYSFQVRENDGLTPRLGGRLFQQYLLDQLMADIKNKAYFGQCIGVMYVVEFQKRGLPHSCNVYDIFPRSTALEQHWMKVDFLFICDIRQLFVHIIVNCKGTDLKHLWDSHWKNMVDDILLRRRERISNAKLTLNDKQLQFYALAEIDNLLRSIGKCLKKFDQLPQPLSSYLNNGSNNLIIEETSYDIVEMENEFVKLFADFTIEQREVYNAVLNSVEMATGGLFFVYASNTTENVVYKEVFYNLPKP